MRVFVSEYVTSGAMSDRVLPDSLLREGNAMRRSLTTDLKRIPGSQVSTTLDHRLQQHAIPGGDVLMVDSVDAEQAAFDQLAAAADVTLIIAPETDGILEQRVDRVTAAGRKIANCSADAIRLCSDKWCLYQHLVQNNLPTIPTALADFDTTDPWDMFASSIVLKPRDGAGSWLTFHLPETDRNAWQTAQQECHLASVSRDRMLVQPFIKGISLSVSCLCDASGVPEIFPVGCQNVTGPRFEYQGGFIPAEISVEASHAIRELIFRTCSTIPGLRGYVGFDLILPDKDPGSPVITEINPRLTTSYVGYRQLCDSNLAEVLLHAVLSADEQTERQCLRWKSGQVAFSADGTSDFVR